MKKLLVGFSKIHLLIVLLALIQACLLSVINEYGQAVIFFGTYNTSLFVFYTLSIAIPVMLMLTLREPTDKWPWLIVLVYAGLLALLAAYSGYQCDPMRFIGCGHNIPIYILTIGVASFILLLFIQVWLDRRDKVFPYAALFDYSWSNFLTIMLTAILVGLLWGILLLWARLFELLGIEFFGRIFTSELFAYPVTGIAVGFGVILFRSQSDAVSVLRKLLSALMRILLPLFALVTLLFLLALPFTGLEPIWGGGYGIFTSLFMMGSLLFFINAVYQDGGSQPYPQVVHRYLQLAMPALIVLTGLGFYGVADRVIENPWTVALLWSVVLTLVFGGFALAYCVAVLKQRDQWLSRLGLINKTVALAVVSVCLLANSPMLDFRKISANSQFQYMTEDGENLRRLDYNYFALWLGRPGEITLRRLLETDLVQEQKDTVLRIEKALGIASQKFHNGELNEEQRKLERLRHLNIHPKGFEAPAALLDKIYELSESMRKCSGRSSCYLLVQDMNRDSRDDYILIHLEPVYSGYMWVLWEQSNGSFAATTKRYMKGQQADELSSALQNGDYKAVSPVWDDFMVGGKRFIVR